MKTDEREAILPSFKVLDSEEKEIVKALAEKIDLSNTNSMLQYGVSIQNQIAELSDSALRVVQNVDAGKVAQLLSSLICKITDFNVSRLNPNKRTKFFLRKRRREKEMIEQYGNIEANVDKIILELELCKIQMMKDIARYDHLYQENHDFCNSISLHIMAGEKKLEEMNQPHLEEAAERSKEQTDIQALDNIASACVLLDKRITDLKLTRTISIQIAAQIRMLKANESQLAEKIKSTIVNTIPLWKSQFALALGIANVESAYRAGSTMSDADIIGQISEAMVMSKKGVRLKADVEQELVKYIPTEDRRDSDHV